ncbi:MAG: hypothetical protein ABSB74_12365 [Tepidisphaeraceae bacterium]
MTRAWIAPPMLLLAFMAGCAAEPFTRPPLPLLKNPNPQAMRDNVAHAVPDRFTSDDTVIIQAPFRNDMAVLGVLRVNRPAGTFELVGLNQLGVKLFHLSGDPRGNSIRFAIPPLMENKDLLMGIAEDIRRMFFDLVPDSGAKIDVRSTTVRFCEKTSQGKMVYELGGDPPILLDKQLVGCFGPIWRVRYFQYASSPGSLYPRGIVMDNSHYHYRIIVKNRGWGVE